MSTEDLLRRHFGAAAAAVEVTTTPADAIVGHVRWARTVMGLATAAVLIAVIAVTGLMSRNSDELIGPATTITPTTAPIVTETTTTTTRPQDTTTTTTTVTTAPTPTTSVEAAPTDVAWSEAEAVREVENYLAELAAGAYEQAAWPVENNGGMLDGQASDEMPVEYLQRVCAGGRCAGPYTVSANGPGVIDPVTSQASSTVTVTHAGSGESAALTLATFEGQRMVLGVPPLVVSEGAPGLVERLFGEDVPDRVVVQRFDAFEIWERGQQEWVTNWWSGQVEQIEGNAALVDQAGTGYQRVVAVTDPSSSVETEWGCLMTRGGDVLLLNGCWTGEWAYTDLATGESLATPISFEQGETESRWFTERAGTVVTGWNDVDGNLVSVEANGVDLEGDDYIGYLKLSVDGTKVAYTDHRDPNSYSHFYSPVVVVKDVATGNEIGRWVLDGPVGGLEFSGDWVVATELTGDIQALSNGDFGQVAVDAINIVTGTVNRVETGTRVFLPS
jgi:hypothetical protein